MDVLLRETLGKRLYEIGNELRDHVIRPEEPAWEYAGSMTRECWRILADECIRQMKFTWLSAKWASPETMSWDTEVLEDGEPDFKIAPDDWRP